MKNSTPVFPGFHLRTLRRKPRSERQKFAEKMVLLRQKSFKQIGEVFKKFIPKNLLKPEQAGAMSRQRLFSKENTFWAFFSQVLNADGGCKEVIRKFQSYASVRGINVPSSSTASYCTARKKLDESMLEDILEHTARGLEESAGGGLINGRRVIVVDGTGVSMPDTPENQEVWPQSALQKPGCGFPTARICALFSLKSGALLSYALGCSTGGACRLKWPPKTTTIWPWPGGVEPDLIKETGLWHPVWWIWQALTGESYSG